MDDPEPERDAVGQAPSESTNWSSAVVLVGIPMAYLVGFGIWMLFNVRLMIVIGYSSVLAWAQLIAMILLAPPTT